MKALKLNGGPYTWTLHLAGSLGWPPAGARYWRYTGNRPPAPEWSTSKYIWFESQKKTHHDSLNVDFISFNGISINLTFAQFLPTILYFFFDDFLNNLWSKTQYKHHHKSYGICWDSNQTKYYFRNRDLSWKFNTFS